MTETDSFIEEVSEEVRRDKLFGFFKKYAWAFALLVVAIVGGAALREYLTARTDAENQANGEAFRVAAEAGTAAAYADLAESDIPAAVLAKLDQAAILEAEGQRGAAATVLDSIASDSSVPALYRDLALLKLVIVNGANMDAADLDEALAVLSDPDAPFRLLAMEQRALAEIRAGDTTAALAVLADIMADANATQDLRNRAQQLTISLGGGTPSGQ